MGGASIRLAERFDVDNGSYQTGTAAYDRDGTTLLSVSLAF